MRDLLTALHLGLILATGCGNNSKITDSTPARYSGFCQDADGCELYAEYNIKTTFDSVASSCKERENGQWTLGNACPSANLVGTCAMPLDGAPADFKGSVTLHFYAPTTSTQANGICTESSGTFTAKP